MKREILRGAKAIAAFLERQPGWEDIEVTEQMVRSFCSSKVDPLPHTSLRNIVFASAVKVARWAARQLKQRG